MKSCTSRMGTATDRAMAQIWLHGMVCSTFGLTYHTVTCFSAISSHAKACIHVQCLMFLSPWKEKTGLSKSWHHFSCWLRAWKCVARGENWEHGESNLAAVDQDHIGFYRRVRGYVFGHGGMKFQYSQLNTFQFSLLVKEERWFNATRPPRYVICLLLLLYI